ncbi:flippase [Metschnikowia bicuspidata]|uniref:Man(5)GlcNAc(2)-PP-dolichol translocation protein RFT1 n=1 Tax=Metschnikowia bicuspidata TaxID=27322 RepID=A0A4P9ZF66_9ASCO|nr:flippase [Metschnikowia bicuspidata]
MKGAIFLILVQAITKGFTFVSNQLLLRSITPEVFGVAAYFEFIVKSVLFFSREAERMSVQRINEDNPQDTHRAVVNFAYLPFLLSWPVLGLVHAMQRSSDIYTSTICSLPNFQWLLAILVLLVEIELLAEPFYSLSQFDVNLKLKSKAESLAVFMKCIVTFVAILFISSLSKSKVTPVMAFALGHLAYSSTFYFVYWRNNNKGYPTISTLRSGTYLNQKVLPIWRSFSLQMILKHLLTGGDTLIVSYFFSASELGAYSVISNYGSLLARLLFQPIEETLHVSMAKMFSGKDKNYKESYASMKALTIFYSNLCSLVVLGGYSNGSFMLFTVLGSSSTWQKSDVFSVFPYYILYIPFMAANGIFEGFFSSVSTHQQIGRFSMFMSLLSIAVSTLLYVLIGKLHMGIIGLIISNIANMVLRITYCLLFMRLFYKDKVNVNLWELMKRLLFPIVLALTAYAAQYTIIGGLMTSTLKEFLISLALCCLSLFGNLWNERALIKSLLSPNLKE